MKNKWIPFSAGSLVCLFVMSFARSATPISVSPQAIPSSWGSIKHIVVITLENNSAAHALAQPYLKSLLQQGGYLSKSFAITHPSQPNYVAFVAGSTLGVTNNSSVNLSAPFIVNLLDAKKLSWKVYAENYPGNCFNSSGSGNYTRRHNPFIAFSAIRANAAQCGKIVNASYFFTDLNANNLPSFSFYIPNVVNQGHSPSTVAFASEWLNKTFGPVFKNASVLQNTLFIVTFDEDDGSAANNIYTNFIGAAVKPGTSSSIRYSTYSILRTIEDILGIGNLGRSDAGAAPVLDIWQGNTTQTGTVALTNNSVSDTQCASASDTLFVDGSLSGTSFITKNGLSTILVTGSHTLALASTKTPVPAGGGQSGTCVGTLSTSSVTVAPSATTTISALWKFKPAETTTGTLMVSAAGSSDTRCSAAKDTLFVDGSTTGTSFTPQSGLSKTLTTGIHTFKLASESTAIPVSGGSCKGILSPDTVTISANQITSSKVTYTYTVIPSGMACKISSATVTQQSDWGLPTLINSFRLSVDLTGVVTTGIQLSGRLTMKNAFVQNFWGSFGFQSSVTGATGTFAGTLYGNKFTLEGFIMNTSPLKIGENPALSLAINGVNCSLPS